MSIFKVACIQNCANSDRNSNLDQLEVLIRESYKTGVKLVCLPETCDVMNKNFSETIENAEPEQQNTSLLRFRSIAEKLKIWISVGSIMIKDPNHNKVINRSFILSPAGTIHARYDKIHLFEALLSTSENYLESEYISPGNKLTRTQLPLAHFGMSICYDIRNPTMYRMLAQEGAECILIPAAFTKTTGAAHWKILTRARAIETGCFIIAANQCGRRTWGQETFGHSIIVDPWGEVLTEAEDSEGFITASIDLKLVTLARTKIPSLSKSILE